MYSIGIFTLLQGLLRRRLGAEMDSGAPGPQKAVGRPSRASSGRCSGETRMETKCYPWLVKHKARFASLFCRAVAALLHIHRLDIDELADAVVR